MDEIDFTIQFNESGRGWKHRNNGRVQPATEDEILLYNALQKALAPKTPKKGGKKNDGD
jgi:hypothetical protein